MPHWSGLVPSPIASVFVGPRLAMVLLPSDWMNSWSWFLTANGSRAHTHTLTCTVPLSIAYTANTYIDEHTHTHIYIYAYHISIMHTDKYTHTYIYIYVYTMFQSQSCNFQLCFQWPTAMTDIILELSFRPFVDQVSQLYWKRWNFPGPSCSPFSSETWPLPWKKWWNPTGGWPSCS